MDSIRKNLRWYILLGLFVVVAFIWYAVFKESRNGELRVSFLNIGQGDAIFIEAPSGKQMMIDGGPGRSVLSELGRMMPFYDRSIDMLLVSNPDKDHMAGFIDVLKSYRVESVVEPGTEPATEVYRVFEEAIRNEHAEKVLARRGMRINLGAETYFDILFPDRDVSQVETNTGSIVGKLVYKNFCIIFPGDAPDETEKYVTVLGAEDLDCDVLKAGHHGSRTSSSDALLKAVSPKVAIISAGKDNKYGHPHQEVLDRFAKHSVQVFGTYDSGRITIVSDGNSFTIK